MRVRTLLCMIQLRVNIAQRDPTLKQHALCHRYSTSMTHAMRGKPNLADSAKGKFKIDKVQRFNDAMCGHVRLTLRMFV